MQAIINNLKKEILIEEDTSVSLLESFGKHKVLVTSWTKKFG